MSDHLTSAAASMGIPEDLVKRSADARASADGTTVDAVLAAWSGGAPLPEASAPTSPVPDAPTAAPESPATPAPEAPEALASPAASAPQAVAPAVSPARSATPVLEGQHGRPMMAIVGILGLFFLGLIITLIIPRATGGDYTHRVPDAEISAAGEAGLDVYLSEGCWYCHTQLVRPVLADVGLGPVTETFSDPLDTAAFGIQRIGPDLAHIGSRGSLRGDEGDISAAEIQALLTDPHSVNPHGLHPTFSYLSAANLAALTTYLLELK